jgi:hypothetical protein
LAAPALRRDNDEALTASSLSNGGDGKILWELPLNSQPGGFPMTFATDGTQYVAIPVGPSLIGNRVVRQLTPEIPVPSRGSALLVFVLRD